MSFRFKTIVGVAAIEAVLLLVLIVSSLSFLRDSNEAQLIKRANTTGMLFATTVGDAVIAYDVAALRSIAKQVMRNPDVLYVRILGANSNVLAQEGSPEQLRRRFVEDTRYDAVDDGVYDTAQDIEIAGERYGRVEVGISTAAIGATLLEARQQVVAIALTEMVLVAVFSWLLGSYLTRGLNKLRAASERLSHGDVNHRLEIKGNDELAMTSVAFNEMLERLSRSQHAREEAERKEQALRQDLEHRVSMRTEELAAVNRQLVHQTLHDQLTGIPNRTLLFDRLSHGILAAKREGKALALMFIDLDNFKEINDSLGHHAGDAILKIVAERLQSVLRKSDTVARLGGDEFALVLPCMTDLIAASRAATKVLAAVSEPAYLDGRMLDIRASLGVALYPTHGESAEALMRRADIAMYAAKRSRSCYAMYSDQLEEVDSAALSFQSELRAAIESNGLVLHYQPKLNLSDNRVGSVEALARWPHASRGMVSPDTFIRLAERTGLIKPLTEWVLNTALRQCVEWRRSGIELDLSVNISPINLQDPDFVRTVAAALRKAGASPEWLELEITETAIMADPARAIDMVEQLSNFGVRFAIDDFGAGYSSMMYLKKLAVSSIKIDKSFVIDMLADNSDHVIVRSMIGLGHNLGIAVVAEGVETDEILKTLRTLGCDVAQGYGVARPMPAADVPIWLERYQHRVAM